MGLFDSEKQRKLKEGKNLDPNGKDLFLQGRDLATDGITFAQKIPGKVSATITGAGQGNGKDWFKLALGGSALGYGVYRGWYWCLLEPILCLVRWVRWINACFWSLLAGLTNTNPAGWNTDTNAEIQRQNGIANDNTKSEDERQTALVKLKELEQYKITQSN